MTRQNTVCSSKHCGSQAVARGMCRRCYAAAWRAARPAAARAYYAANRIEILHYRKLFYAAHRSRIMAARAAAADLILFGLTPDARRALEEGQRGLCAACGDPPTGMLLVDIDGTGAIRGLICSPCNRAIGLMRASPERLRSAAEYLVRSTQK